MVIRTAVNVTPAATWVGRTLFRISSQVQRSSSMGKRAASPFEIADINANIIKEGRAEIEFPKGEVFYNPVQQFNRDLSIAVISTFAKDYLSSRKKQNLKGISIFEGLSATGLRSIRYAREVPDVVQVTANDLDPSAVELIRQNVKRNFSEGQEDAWPVLNVTQGDANSVLHRLAEQGTAFDVIDLDPYGSAAPFIDSAVQKISNGGLLCVTCTDLAVLCATHAETCFAKYGGLPLRGDTCHEAALRLILQSLEISANRYKRHIIPLVSCSIDFYARVFVKVVESPEKVKLSSTYQFPVKDLVTVVSKATSGGGNQFLSVHELIPETCRLCSSRVELCGPMWLGPLHCREFVESVLCRLHGEDHENLATRSRIVGFLTVISEEIDSPFFYSLPEMASFLKISVPSMLLIRSALLNAGFSVSGSHCHPNAIKTDAPSSFLWKSLHASDNRAATEATADQGRTPRLNLLHNLDDSEICFDLHPDANPKSRSEGLVRFPENPTKNWGPLARARKN